MSANRPAKEKARRSPTEKWAVEQMINNIKGTLPSKEEIRAEALRMFAEALDRELSDLNPGEGLGVVFRFDVIKEDRRSAAYAQWRTDVYERDSYCCRLCGKGGDLQAHHIMPWAKYPDLRFEVNNGITLCVDCHARFHPGMTFGKKGRVKNSSRDHSDT